MTVACGDVAFFVLYLFQNGTGDRSTVNGARDTVTVNGALDFIT